MVSIHSVLEVFSTKPSLFFCCSYLSLLVVEEKKKVPIEEDKPIDEDPIEETTAEEEEQPPPPADIAMPSFSKSQQSQSSKAVPPPRSALYKYQDNEIRWDAVFQSSKYIAKGFHRDEIIIEPPASFDGAEGTDQVGFENDNRVLVLKIAPNPVLSDPHAINSYYAKMYGVITADDSARHQAFKHSAKAIADKWYTFHYHLDWPGKPSEDLGMIPWLDYADFESDGRSFPMIILNISSIRPIEERAKKMSAKLVKKAFKSPAKVNGVNMSGDRTAQMASLLEDMITSGQMTPEMKRAFRKFAGDGNEMDESSDNNNKRAATGYRSSDESFAGTSGFPDLFN